MAHSYLHLDETLERIKLFAEDQPRDERGRFATDVSISKIEMHRLQFDQASKNIAEGKVSKTSGPVRLERGPQGRIRVDDGYHRIIEAHARGERTIKAFVAETKSWEGKAHPESVFLSGKAPAVPDATAPTGNSNDRRVNFLSRQYSELEKITGGRSLFQHPATPEEHAEARRRALKRPEKAAARHSYRYLDETLEAIKLAARPDLRLVREVLYSEDQARDDNGRWASEGPDQHEAHIDSLRNEIHSTLPKGSELYLSSPHADEIYVDGISIAEDKRSEGHGGRAMREVLAYADARNLKVSLNPQPDPGKKGALQRFYRGLGFGPISSSRFYDPVAKGSWVRPKKSERRSDQLSAREEADLVRQMLYSEDQPRDDHGRFGSGSGSGGGHAATGRAWTGKPTPLKAPPSKRATGKIGEATVISYLHSIGLTDAKLLNTFHENFPVDLVQDHGAIEVKTGLVSNSTSAQQWRATIGEPSDTRKEWLKTASPEAKARFNEKQAELILQRKEAVRAQLSKELGRPVKAWTYGVIANPDKGTADIYRFEGFHLRLAWNSDEAKKAFVKTVKLAKP